jgi:hypothetical protein
MASHRGHRTRPCEQCGGQEQAERSESRFMSSSAWGQRRARGRWRGGQCALSRGEDSDCRCFGVASSTRQATCRCVIRQYDSSLRSRSRPALNHGAVHSSLRRSWASRIQWMRRLTSRTPPRHWTLPTFAFNSCMSSFRCSWTES